MMFKSSNNHKQDHQVEVEVGGGGGPAGDNIPNALTYSSRKKSNWRQHEREEFQNKLLETLKNDGDQEEQDTTDLAMLALVKKMKFHLNDDQQEELIEELQQVVGRFCKTGLFLLQQLDKSYSKGKRC